MLIPSYRYYNACYKNFTAKLSQKPTPDLLKFQYDTKSTYPLLPSATEVLPPICIFCNKGRKKIGGSWKEPGKNEKHETEIAILNKAKMLNDESMILKIVNYNFGERPDFVAKEVHYHYECKRNYPHKKDKSSNIKDSALERLLSYVRNKIIAENKPELATFLLDLYKQYYAAEGGNENDLVAYNAQNMCRMLQLRIPLNIEAKNENNILEKGEYEV